MRAIVYRLRLTLRSSLGSLAFAAAATAIVAGVLLALAAGAQRTASAPARYTAKYFPGIDLTVTQEGGAPLTGAVRRLPGVEAVDSLTFVFGGLKPVGTGRGAVRDGRDGVDATCLAGTIRGGGMRLIEGREPSPARAGEFDATQSFVDATHSRIGDRFELRTISDAQARSTGFATEDPHGPVVAAVLVGIMEGPNQLEDPSPTAIFSSAVLARPHIGIAFSPMGVDLRPGVTTAQFRSQLATVRPAATWSIEPAQLISPNVRNAVRGEAEGLWALTAVAAFVSIAVLGQLIVRQVRLPHEEEAKLRSIGLTRAQLVVERLLLALTAIGAGTAIGAIGAVVASSRFPTGFVRRLEASPGIRVEWRVLVPGIAALVLTLAAWALVALATSRRAGEPRSSTLVEAVATRCPSAAMATGLRSASSRGEGATGATRTATAGLCLAMVCLVGALTFGTSVDRLIDQPWRYGNDYPLGFGTGEQQISQATARELARDPDIDSVTYYSVVSATSQKRLLWLVGYRIARGNLPPTLLAGRLPAADDEIALGRLMAKALHVRIGGTVVVDYDGKAHPLHLTGLVIVPAISGNAGVGQDGLLTRTGLQRIAGDVGESSATVSARAGATHQTLAGIWQRGLGWHSPAPLPDFGTSVPAVIVNVDRVRSIPYLLACVLGLLVLLAIGHAVWTSARRRRRDTAILHALGADHRFISRALHWQATAITIVPVALAIPFGIAVGSRGFRAFADAMGVVDDAAFPFVLTAAALGCALGVANATSGLIARRLRGRPLASLLHAE